MRKFRINKNYTALLLLFLIINLICLLYKNGYIHAALYIDINVVVVANALLFLLALFGTYRHIASVRDPNPNVFIRSIMMMTVLKFFVLCGAAIIYILLAKQNRNVPGIIIGMILYVLYSILETRGAFMVNKKK
ncbi:MAG: hypothetical protein PW786_14295 [Arachidicoccus sp.]|nr:hypothetical protein [Arachidicoccus sp.]